MRLYKHTPDIVRDKKMAHFNLAFTRFERFYHNYTFSKRNYFIQKMGEVLQHGAFMFIHYTSGFFYSQGYANKWIAIATSRPSVVFIAHLRSDYERALDFTNKPFNFPIVYYQNVYDTAASPKWADKICYPRNGVEHCYWDKTGFKCMYCRLCWETNNSIVIHRV